MKADEPGNRLRLVKYGMPASEVPGFEARHALVMQERGVLDAVAFRQAMIDGAAITQTLALTERLPVPVAAYPEPVVTTLADEPAMPELAPSNLRASLGLE